MKNFNLKSFLLIFLAMVLISNTAFAEKRSDDFGREKRFSENSSSLEIEADIFTDITTVKIEMNDRKNSFTTGSTTREDIIKDILAKYPNLTKEQVDAVLKIETENRASAPKDTAGEKRPIATLFDGKMKESSDKERGEHSGKIKLPTEAVLKRFSGAIKHIEKFISRFEVLIIKMESEGKNTSSAKAFLNLTKTDLGEAKDYLKKAEDAHKEGGLSAKDVIRENLGKMKEEIRSAFANLKSTKNALKALKNEITEEDNQEKN